MSILYYQGSTQADHVPVQICTCMYEVCTLNSSLTSVLRVEQILMSSNYVQIGHVQVRGAPPHSS